MDNDDMCALSPGNGLKALMLAAWLLLTGACAGVQAAELRWQELEPGLELATHSFSRELASQDLLILKIDQDRYRLTLLSASEQNSQRLTLHDWVKEHDLLAAINASMFWTDQETSTGFMKNFEHVNNTSIHPKYNAFLAFNPKSPELPPVSMVDRVNTREWKDILDDYHTVIQNYRMISDRQTNAWEESDQEFSVAAVGLTREGEVLFIMSLVPRAMHDLNDRLLGLPIELKMCMFVEGGATAGMYVRAGSLDQGWHGSSNTSLLSDNSVPFVRIPNVLGVVKRR
jgi:hypothetical protein